jgi:hypothetical protein
MARPHGARGRAVNAAATLMHTIEGASDRGMLVIRRAVPCLDDRGDGLRERRPITYRDGTAAERYYRRVPCDVLYEDGDEDEE